MHIIWVLRNPQFFSTQLFHKIFHIYSQTIDVLVTIRLSQKAKDILLNKKVILKDNEYNMCIPCRLKRFIMKI